MIVRYGYAVFYTLLWVLLHRYVSELSIIARDEANCAVNLNLPDKAWQNHSFNRVEHKLTYWMYSWHLDEMLLRSNIYFIKKRLTKTADWSACQGNFQLHASQRYCCHESLTTFAFIVNYINQLWHKISNTTDAVPSYIPSYLQVLPSTDTRFLVSHRHSYSNSLYIFLIGYEYYARNR